MRLCTKQLILIPRIGKFYYNDNNRLIDEYCKGKVAQSGCTYIQALNGIANDIPFKERLKANFSLTPKVKANVDEILEAIDYILNTYYSG
jgi:hypothetical protein